MKLSIKEENPLLGRPIEIEFDIYESSLEGKLLDSNDFTLYGFGTVNDFVESNNTVFNKELLIQFQEQVTITSGGRLDILIGTSNGMMKLLGKLYLEDAKDVSLLNRLHDKLEYHESEDALEYVYKITTVEEAINILMG